MEITGVLKKKQANRGVAVDRQMCPSTVSGIYHSVADRNPKPEAILSQDPVNVAFVDPSVTPTQVACTYSPDAIRTIHDIWAWKKEFGDDETLRTQIMPRFCRGLTPKDSCSATVRANENGCSRFFAQGDEGEACSLWRQAPQNEALYETAIATFCGSNDTTDCACARRGVGDSRDAQVYRNLETAISKLEGTGQIPDICFWPPCKNPSARLIPPSTWNQKGNCPRDFCTIYNQAIDNAKITFTGSTQQVMCSGGSTITEGGDDDNGDDGSPRKIWPWIAAGAAVLVAVIVVWFLYRRSHKPPKPE